MSKLAPDAEALVEAVRDVLRPTEADRARNLAALTTRLPAGAFGGSEPPAAPPRAIRWPTLAKVALGLAVSAGLVFFGLRGAENRPDIARPTASAASSSIALQVPAAPLPEPAELPSQTGTTATPPPSRGARKASDHLAEEVAILSRAETELRAGHYAAALAALDEHARTFPHGTLAQERIAARVQALCGLGRRTAAEAEVKRLTPGSLSEAQAREACGMGGSSGH